MSIDGAKLGKVSGWTAGPDGEKPRCVTKKEWIENRNYRGNLKERCEQVPMKQLGNYRCTCLYYSASVLKENLWCVLQQIRTNDDLAFGVNQWLILWNKW